MNAEYVAELTTQILVAAIQNNKFDVGNMQYVCNYYEAIARQINVTAQEQTVQQSD